MILDLLRTHLQDPATAWAAGTFGAIGEFSRDPGEAADVTALSVVTPRGALRLVPRDDLAPFAYETATATGWSQTLALCLPAEAARGAGRTVLTEVGPDAAAIRPVDRRAILFDLGLGCRQVDVLIRVADPAAAARLRPFLGRPVFEPGSGAMAEIFRIQPPRVFETPLGRVEVFQPIPPADGRSPDGPHSHVLPKLLRSGRTHAATVPIPDALVPCVFVFPAHPAKDTMGRPRSFDAAAHAAFQTLLARFGDPTLLVVKRAVADALRAGRGPDEATVPDNRHARAAARVAVAQIALAEPSAPGLAAWSALLRAPVESDDETPEH